MLDQHFYSLSTFLLLDNNIFLLIKIVWNHDMLQKNTM